MFSRHPVDSRVISQGWGVNKTGGVTPNQHGTPVQQLVFHYGNYQPMGHDGIDYACPVGTPVYASGAGIVEYAGWGQNMPQHIAAKYGFAYGAAGWASGIIACIDHGGSLGSYSAHMSQWNVNPGQHVTANTVVGLSGNTGRSGGPHVHWSAIRFPVNYSDPLYSRVNPLDYFTVVTNTPIIPGVSGGTIQAPAPIDPLEEIMSYYKDRADFEGHQKRIVREELTKMLPEIAKAVWNISLPLSTGGTTKPATKVKYEAQLFKEAESRDEALLEAIKSLAPKEEV